MARTGKREMGVSCAFVPSALSASGHDLCPNAKGKRMRPQNNRPSRKVRLPLAFGQRSCGAKRCDSVEGTKAQDQSPAEAY